MSDDWRAEAACRDMDTNVFFPGQGGDTWTPKAVCKGCPVKPDCFQFSLDNKEQFGIWGGQADRDRRRRRASLRAS